MAAPKSAPVPQIQLPGCKSLSQRALMLAASARGTSLLSGLSDCDDSRLLRCALEALGVGFSDLDTGTVEVTGLGGAPQGNGVVVDVGEAGSSLRFLLPWCAAGRGSFLLTGAPRLFERPHQVLIDFLVSKGVQVHAEKSSSSGGTGRPGFRVVARGLPPGEWLAPVRDSSQYLSGLMMAAASCGEVSIPLPANLPSRGYFDLTCAAMRAFRGDKAVQIESRGEGSLLRLAPGVADGISWTVPADPSAATFFLVALVLTGGALQFVTPWSPIHPEAQLLKLFKQHGLLKQGDAKTLSDLHWQASGKFPSKCLDVHLDNAPDAGPALAVLGAYLPHGMRMTGIARLRMKESDRIAGIQRLLTLLGQSVEVSEGELFIPGSGSPGFAAAGGNFDPDQDHRLAMAAGVAAIHAKDLRVLDPDCVNKSFPGFWDLMLSGTSR